MFIFYRPLLFTQSLSIHSTYINISMIIHELIFQNLLGQPNRLCVLHKQNCLPFFLVVLLRQRPLFILLSRSFPRVGYHLRLFHQLEDWLRRRGSQARGSRHEEIFAAVLFPQAILTFRFGHAFKLAYALTIRGRHHLRAV